MSKFRQKIEALSQQWIDQGLPSREVLVSSATSLLQWRQQHRENTLWSTAPRLVTATLDDGIGQGIDMINLFARVMGLEVTPLGLMLKPEIIMDVCRRHMPDYLGLTVLQLDSEDDLAAIGHQLAPQIRLIAGGPAFMYDKELALRCAVQYVAPNVAYFIDYVLKGKPEQIPSSN